MFGEDAIRATEPGEDVVAGLLENEAALPDCTLAGLAPLLACLDLGGPNEAAAGILEAQGKRLADEVIAWLQEAEAGDGERAVGAWMALRPLGLSADGGSDAS